VIQFEDVSLQFAGAPRPAVDRVSAQVQAGELVVLLGPSGCGKTTLLKLVNRLYEPTAGQILLDGQATDRLPVTKLRRRMGYVIQQSGLFPHLSVADNIAVVPRLLGWARPRIQARVDELLHLVRLPAADYRRRYPAQLSGGQQQRVGIARALAADPTMLLMDEPFGAIDAITRTALQDEVRRLHRELGKTILFVSHDVEEALRLADRILVMNQGRVVQFDQPLTLLQRPANDFVRDLLGTTDRVRHLGLLPVTSAMATDGLAQGQPSPGSMPPGPTVPADASLRQALSTLLQTGATALTVVRDRTPLGTITLDAIRRAAQQDPHGLPD